MLTRLGKCEHCGQCCGRVTEDGQSTNPWGGMWPASLVALSEEACNQVPLYRLIKPPHISGNVSGIVKLNGREFHYLWLNGLRKSLEDHSCPFLYEENGLYLCGVYGTEYHVIWEKTCNTFPKDKMFLSEAIKTFLRYPECTFYYDYSDEDLE